MHRNSIAKQQNFPKLIEQRSIITVSLAHEVQEHETNDVKKQN